MNQCHPSLCHRCHNFNCPRNCNPNRPRPCCCERCHKPHPCDCDCRKQEPCDLVPVLVAEENSTNTILRAMNEQIMNLSVQMATNCDELNAKLDYIQTLFQISTVSTAPSDLNISTISAEDSSGNIENTQTTNTKVETYDLATYNPDLVYNEPDIIIEDGVTKVAKKTMFGNKKYVKQKE